MTENIVDKLKKNPDLFKETALFVTFDEGGGYWDSGFFQPIDMFGDGKTALKFNIGRYLEAAQNGGLFIASRPTSRISTTATR